MRGRAGARATDNEMGDEGAIVLAGAFRVNRSLVNVSLAGECVGRVAVARPPHRVHAIHSASAAAVGAWLCRGGDGGDDGGGAENRIGPGGATALADAFKVNSRIFKLNLNSACRQRSARGAARA